LPTVVAALKLLAANNYATIVISNQSGIARGLLDDAKVRSVNAEIVRRLAGDELTIDGWYWCPHYDEGCDCRKPAPALLHQAVREHGLTLDGAAMIGDRGSDVELGQRVGIPGIAVPGRCRTSARNRICARKRCSKRRNGSCAVATEIAVRGRASCSRGWPGGASS